MIALFSFPYSNEGLVLSRDYNYELKDTRTSESNGTLTRTPGDRDETCTERKLELSDEQLSVYYTQYEQSMPSYLEEAFSSFKERISAQNEKILLDFTLYTLRYGTDSEEILVVSIPGRRLSLAHKDSRAVVRFVVELSKDIEELFLRGQTPE
jgi:hypothetical protein